MKRFILIVAGITVMSVLSGAAFASDFIHETDQLSQARNLLSATTVGNKAIFAGGYSSVVGSSDVVDIYDADSDTWSTYQLSQSRSNMGATTVGNIAFFAGGRYWYHPLRHCRYLRLWHQYMVH